MNESILIRRLLGGDCQTISDAFRRQDWNKPTGQFQNYFNQQKKGERDVFIAEVENQFAGYITILRQSEYPPFRKKYIPEINDFNVLIKFRRRGIGTALINAAETLIAEKYGTVGIGVGLTADYGAAQQLYVKRGYIPDGLGISQKGKILKYGDNITIDEDLTLWFTKKLIRP